MVESGRENQEKVVEKKRLEIQVKLDGFVIELDVRHFGDDILRKTKIEVR